MHQDKHISALSPTLASGYTQQLDWRVPALQAEFPNKENFPVRRGESCPEREKCCSPHGVMHLSNGSSENRNVVTASALHPTSHQRHSGGGCQIPFPAKLHQAKGVVFTMDQQRAASFESIHSPCANGLGGIHHVFAQFLSVFSFTGQAKAEGAVGARKGGETHERKKEPGPSVAQTQTITMLASLSFTKQKNGIFLFNVLCSQCRLRETLFIVPAGKDSEM